MNTRTAFYTVIFTLLLFIGLVISWQAQAASSYLVENISVDVSAANAVEAREKAFEEAQIKGYKKLADNFFTEAEREALGTPDINIVSAAVRDFEVSKEKISATRYAGTYKIRYDAKAFAKGRAELNPSIAQTTQGQNSPGHILVLPFFEDSGFSMLWKTNPFMQAWSRARDGGYAGASIVPRGDLQDMSAITDSQALNYNSTNVANLQNRYGASQVAILMATPELMPDGSENIVVGIYQAGAYGPTLSQQISVRSQIGEPKDQLYARVVQEVNKVFAQNWQRQVAVPQSAQQATNNQEPQATSGPVQTMVAQVSFSTMRNWMETKRAIERSGGVRGLSVKSLSPRSATVIISYQGGLQNLRRSLGQNGVNLNNPFGAGVYKISSGQ